MDEQLFAGNFYYPLFVDLRGKRVVVIGGGMVALRKIEGFLKTGARVRVVAPEIIDEIVCMPEVEAITRNYMPEDLAGAQLVIAATDDMDTNTAVSAEADARGIFCNVVDKPELCSFIVPSVVDKGPIRIAISTGGVSPALSKKIRFEIGRLLGDEFAALAVIMGRIRPLVLSQGGGHEAHKRIFEVLINSELVDAIRENNRGLAESILFEALGEHIDLTEVFS